MGNGSKYSGNVIEFDYPPGELTWSAVRSYANRQLASAQAQYAALVNSQAQTFGGVAIEVLQARGISMLGGVGQATSQAAALFQAMHNSNMPERHFCELCDSEAHGGALTKASDGSQHWIDMCHDCVRAAGVIR